VAKVGVAVAVQVGVAAAGVGVAAAGVGVAATCSSGRSGAGSALNELSRARHKAGFGDATGGTHRRRQSRRSVRASFDRLAARWEMIQTIPTTKAGAVALITAHLRAAHGR
jgi:hypothetical protein